MVETMRAVEISEPGGPSVLRPCERPVPTPGPREILIKVDAAGVNRPDVLQRMGLYPPPDGASDLPGLEAAGVVAAVGASATRFKPGEAVCALLPGGGYAEYAVADEGVCLPIPTGVSPEEAAGLPETVFTVWANVFDDAGLAADETLLVHGGSSGIGVTAIALAKAFGARALATASSAAKRERISALGADAAFDYTDPDWSAAVIEAGGADVVLDMAGGDFLPTNLKVLKPGGRHVSIAFLRGAKAEINIMMIMRKRLRLSGSTMRARGVAEKARLADAIRETVWPRVAAGEIRPVVDQIYALEDAHLGHGRMEAGEHFGKIILTPHKSPAATDG